MNNDNYSLLNDLYLLVTATDILNENKRRELIKFLDVQIQIEEDSSFDINDYHDPERDLRNYLNGN